MCIQVQYNNVKLRIMSIYIIKLIKRNVGQKLALFIQQLAKN